MTSTLLTAQIALAFLWSFSIAIGSWLVRRATDARDRALAMRDAARGAPPALGEPRDYRSPAPIAAALPASLDVFARRETEIDEIMARQGVRGDERPQHDVRWVAKTDDLAFVQEAGGRGAIVYVDEERTFFRLELFKPSAGVARSIPARGDGAWWVEIDRPG